MAEPTTTTTRRAAHCSKHAFAPSASFRPRNGISGNVTLPAQRHQTGLYRAGLASDSPEADDDPIDRTDKSGLWTEGLCVSLAAGADIASGGVQGCIVEANGNQSVATTVTAFGGASIADPDKLLNDLIEPTVFAKLGLGFSGLFSYQVTNAQTVCDLAGWFNYAGLSAADDVAGGGDEFSGNSSNGTVDGLNLGVGVGEGTTTNFGLSKTWVRPVTGMAASVLADLIDLYTDNPFNLGPRTTARLLIEAIQ